MVQTDPERCSYVPLNGDLDRVVRQSYSAEFEGTVNRLDLSEAVAWLEQVAVSVERDEDGDRWLYFRASDSTTWYISWDGNSAEAIALAKEFGATVAESFAR